MTARRWLDVGVTAAVFAGGMVTMYFIFQAIAAYMGETI